MYYENVLQADRTHNLKTIKKINRGSSSDLLEWDDPTDYEREEELETVHAMGAEGILRCLGSVTHVLHQSSIPCVVPV